MNINNGRIVRDAQDPAGNGQTGMAADIGRKVTQTGQQD